MQNNILAVPFRKGTQLSLSSAVRKYISTKYDQHPDMFRHDLQAIDELRRNAVNVREPHPSGIRDLEAYAAHLVWMNGKFPIDIGADFTWYPSLGYNTERPIVHNNLQFELANILYNLAALLSQLAIGSNRSDTDGLKTAASYFSQSAGVLLHLKNEIIRELRTTPPEDMDEHTLESLIQLQLAQGQECFWQKAVMDGYKDASIAKLAAKVSDFYNLAGEAAMRSEAISSSWIHHMSAKHHHFAAAAQYRAACECLEKRKYGEEVARLRDAVACVNEGLKESRGGYVSKSVVDDLTGLKKKVEEDLKRAERDNDKIYLNPEPSKSELKILDRAAMAAPRTPPQVSKPLEYLGEKGDFGPALFTKLVPYAVHIAVSIYEERRDRLVNQNIIGELESLNERIHEVLSSYNLPGSFQAFEKPMGLPGTLIQHAEEIRQADAIHKLQRCFADIDKLRAADMAVFEEGREILQAEEEEDLRLQRKFGTDRWSRPESRTETTQGAKLWTQVAEAEGWFATSASSDGVVREKFYSIEPTLAILSGPDRGIMDFVPSSRRMEIPESLKPAINRLRSAYNEVTRLESRRRRKADALREKARNDDIKSDILAEAARLERTSAVGAAIVPAHFEAFFERRLDSLYEAELELAAREAQEQEKLLQGDLARAQREFEAQQKRAAGGGSGHREREQALQKLENAYLKYKELVGNVEVARKFYNDLSRIVGGFRDSARAFAAERRQEARVLEDELNMPPLQNLNLVQQQQSQQSQLPPDGGVVWSGLPGPGEIGYQAQPQSQPVASAQNAYFGGSNQREPMQTSIQTAVPLPSQQQQSQRASPVRRHHQQRSSVHSPPPPSSHLSWPPPAPAASAPVSVHEAMAAPQPQQPQRANPMQTMWNPEMGIRFAGSGGGGSGAPSASPIPVPAPGQQQVASPIGGGVNPNPNLNPNLIFGSNNTNRPPPPPATGVGGTWNPSAGIRFG
ncbi:pH-response regulator protein palA/rim20 [Diatrype stigma]|uniref:PH-response regulator protein palA/rim20 n=1 Tax=Diatrype stigma TaxID=117547 RepID=A0AAN9URF0_9PEZI